MARGISVLVVVVLLLLVCIPYTWAQNPGGCSPLPPNTLISGGPSGALGATMSQILKPQLCQLYSDQQLDPRVQTHGQYSVRLRSGSMDCGVKFSKQTQTIWQTAT